MAWLQSKLDNVVPDTPSDERKEKLMQELEYFGITEEMVKERMSEVSDVSGSALSLKDLGLPPDAELVEFVDDKEVVWE